MFEEITPHIVELRKRLVISALALIVGFVICFFFWEPLFDFLLKPLLKILPQNSEVIFTHPAEAFFTAMKVSFFAGFLLTLPIIFWQFWLFVAPGLYDNEKKYVLPFVISATIMFIIGCAFCYILVLPTAFNFLINFGGGENMVAMPRIGEYVGFFIKLMLAFGISFELPIVTFFLALLGLITDKSLKDFFRYAIVLIFVFAAVMTPPDILSQFLLAVPLIVLYVGSIYIAKIINPYKDIDDDEA
ncbi:twin-arginine translocase subunit TatC [Campylobacter corcagiensis]|uniref:Sec-independent protein translocase protein TatC n=1 Tax=Campylobacter corcagiensis TaxID=1448857 RepID=A0A7M1LHH1_9BACT|nr:twin-arginine translocase subunit TatC [Campylobacter corcagiensis]QKF64895.1 twin arginine translocation system, TatC protein [Campylobacter corcagiensis]QOQ86945.1 twin-arginine translocase subunit TatC [Campylobacter corcagiensis]